MFRSTYDFNLAAGTRGLAQSYGVLSTTLRTNYLALSSTLTLLCIHLLPGATKFNRFFIDETVCSGMTLPRNKQTRPSMTEYLIPRIQESSRITWHLTLTLTLTTSWMHADLESIL